jgi:hypothetical protein
LALEDTSLGPSTWPTAGAGLLIAVRVNHGRHLLYTPGRVVDRASGGCRGEGMTDARDALVIADQIRMHRDLNRVRRGDEATVELKLVTGHRTDLVCDRTRAVNRLREAG